MLDYSWKSVSSLLRLFESYNNSPPLPSTVLFDISILLSPTVCQVQFTLGWKSAE